MKRKSNLPLWEAMQLGRLLVKPTYGQLISQSGISACALGMAGLAGGMTKGELLEAQFDESIDGDYRALITKWPVLQKIVKLPCKCTGLEPFSSVKSQSCSLERAIVHLFDEHVKRNREDQWTFEQLVSFVISVEERRKRKALVVEKELDTIPV